MTTITPSMFVMRTVAAKEFRPEAQRIEGILGVSVNRPIWKLSYAFPIHVEAAETLIEGRFASNMLRKLESSEKPIADIVRESSKRRLMFGGVLLGQTPKFLLFPTNKVFTGATEFIISRGMAKSFMVSALGAKQREEQSWVIQSADSHAIQEMERSLRMVFAKGKNIEDPRSTVLTNFDGNSTVFCAQ